MTELALADLLKALTVEVSSPDGTITATLGRNQKARLRMLPRVYANRETKALQTQLAATVTTVFDTYRATRRQLVQAERGLPPQPHQPSPDTPRARLATATQALVVRAASPGAWVRVRSKALTLWSFELADNIAECLDQERFLDETHAAVDTVVADFNTQTLRLRNRHLG